MRVTARQQESERGLARVCQSPRGYVISVDGKQVGSVGHARRTFDGPGANAKPWFWYAGFERPGPERVSCNTASAGRFFATREEARDSCIEWVKANYPASPCMRPDKPGAR